MLHYSRRSARAFLKRVAAVAPLAVPLQAVAMTELPRARKGSREGIEPAQWQALLQPALAFVLDVLLFARQTSALEWLGVAMALLGIFIGIVRLAGRKTPIPHAEEADPA